MVLNLKPAAPLVILLTADPLRLTDAEQASRRTRLLDEQKVGAVDQLALDSEFHRAVMTDSSNSSAIKAGGDRLMLRGSMQTKHRAASEKFADQPNTQRLLVEGYPNCHVDMPSWIGDGICDGDEYNTEACGWDGGDCADPEEWIKYNGQACIFDGALYGNAVEGVDYKKWYDMDLKWCTNKCRKTRVPGTCKAYDFDIGTDRCRVYYTYPEDTKFKDGLTCWKNPMGCAWDGGFCDNTMEPTTEEPTPTEEPTDEWWLTVKPSTEEPTPTEEPTDEWWLTIELSTEEPTQTEEPTDEWWLPPEEPTDPAEEPANDSEDGGSNRYDFTLDCDIIEGSPPAWAACIPELQEIRITLVSDVSLIYERPATCFITKIFYYYDEIRREWYWTPYALNDNMWIPVNTLIVPSGFWAGQKPAQPNVEIISYLDQNNPDPNKACGVINGDTSLEIGTDEQQLEPGSVSIVADIWEGSGSSNPTELTPCGGFLYFHGKEKSSSGTVLYRYDGSDPSSIEVVMEGGLMYLTCFKNELYYFKAPPNHRYSDPWQLAKFDGEEKILYDTAENYYSILFKDWFPGRFIEYQSELYFGVTDKLLKTNGHIVSVVWDMTVGSGPKCKSFCTISLPHFFVENRGSLYFLAETPAVGSESLWKYSKASGGSLVADLTKVTGFQESVDNLFSYNDNLFIHVAAAWSSDVETIYKVVGESLSDSGMTSISGGVTSTDISWVSPGEEFNGSLFLGARARVPVGKIMGWLTTYNKEYQLWEFDGITSKSAVDAASVGIPEFGSRPIEWITPFNNKLFFAASDGTHRTNKQLWSWNGIQATVVHPVYPYEPAWLTPYQGSLYFSGCDDDTGCELYVYKPNNQAGHLWAYTPDEVQTEGNGNADNSKLPEVVVPPANDCDVVADDCPPPAWAACIVDLNELRPVSRSHPHLGTLSHVYLRPTTCSTSRIYYHYNESSEKWFWTPYELDDEIWMPVSVLTVPKGYLKGEIPRAPNAAIISHLNEINPDPRTSCGKRESDPRKFSALTCESIPDRSGEIFEFNETVYDLSLQTLYLSDLVYQENPWPICPGKQHTFYQATKQNYTFTIRDSFESSHGVDQALVAESNGRCFGIFRGTLPPFDDENAWWVELSDWISNVAPFTNPSIPGLCESCRGRAAFNNILRNNFWIPFSHELLSCAKEYCADPADCIVLGGHSQGGAVAEVAAHMYSRYDPWLFTFGRPNSMKNPCPTLSKLRQYNFCNTVEGKSESPVWKNRMYIRHDPVFFVPAGLSDAVWLAKEGNFGYNIFLRDDATVATKLALTGDLKNPLLDFGSFLFAVKAHTPLFGEHSYFQHLNGLYKEEKAEAFPIPSVGWEKDSTCFFDEECVSKECVYPTKGMVNMDLMGKEYIPCSEFSGADVYRSECFCK